MWTAEEAAKRSQHYQHEVMYIHIMIKHFHIQKDNGYAVIIMIMTDVLCAVVVFIFSWSVKKRLIIMKVS